MNDLRAWLLAMLLVAWAWPARAGTVVLDDTFDEVVIGKHLELAYDPSGALTLDDVLAGKLHFTPSTKSVPSFGYRGGAEWARLTLEDRRAHPRERLVLEHGYAPTDLVELTTVLADGSRTAARAGDHVAHDAWPIDARLATFAVPEGTREVYLRLESTASHQLAFTLRPREPWLRHAAMANTVQALYYGALAAMVVYNTMLWASVGLTLYGFYVGFLVSYGAISLQLAGYLFLCLWPRAPWLAYHAVFPLLAACGRVI